MGFTTVTFMTLSLIMLPFAFFFFNATKGAFTLMPVLFLFSFVLCAGIANLLYYKGFKYEKINHLEPIIMMQPLFVVVLAALVFPSERNFVVIMAALIASVAIVLSHIKNHHLEFNKHSSLVLISNLFFAVCAIQAKYLLNYFSPFTLYFLRCSLIGLILFVTYRPKLKYLTFKEEEKFALSNIFWIARSVLIYYGYVNFGIIFTTLVLMVTPILVYTFTYFILKERLEMRNLVASAVILICLIAVV